MDKSPGFKAQTASSSTKPSTKCPWGVGRSSNGLSATGNDLEGFYEASEAPNDFAGLSQKKRTVRLPAKTSPGTVSIHRNKFLKSQF
jgi:hypothetical protein